MGAVDPRRRTGQARRPGGGLSLPGELGAALRREPGLEGGGVAGIPRGPAGPRGTEKEPFGPRGPRQEPPYQAPEGARGVVRWGQERSRRWGQERSRRGDKGGARGLKRSLFFFLWGGGMRLAKPAGWPRRGGSPGRSLPQRPCRLPR